MAYCSKCGQRNPDDSKFCNKCGATLDGGPPRDYKRERDKECENECAGGKKNSSIFWAVIIILIGLWIVFEFGVKNIPDLPPSVRNFEFWWVIPVIIGIAVIVTGISMMSKRSQAK